MQFISTRSKFRVEPRICACVRDQRYTTDIGSNYILQNDPSMVAAKGWLSEATVVQTPPSVAAGSDAHLSCLCVSIVRFRLRAKRSKRRKHLWLHCLLLGKNREILKVSCVFTRIARLLFVLASFLKFGSVSCVNYTT